MLNRTTPVPHVRRADLFVVALAVHVREQPQHRGSLQQEDGALRGGTDVQNRYVGDVGDFGKHGLLRYLSGITAGDNMDPLRLGLIWYMVPDERHGPDRARINGDGRHTGYLAYTSENLRDFAACDRPLWDALGHLVGMDARCVHCAQEAGLLPEDTLYYDATLAYVPGGTREAREVKRLQRAVWWEGALRATAPADLVCLDPDNGLMGDAQMHRATGPKFTYMSDLHALWERGQSLVVYQHTGRTGGDAVAQTRAKAATVRGGLGADTLSLLFRAGSVRTFIIALQPEHEGVIHRRVGRLMDGAWAEHFEWVA